MTAESGDNDRERVIVYIDPALESIVPGFLENRRKDAAALDAALHGNDWKTVRLLGHRMKGDGGGYGFKEISRIGNALEQAALREDRTIVKQQTTALVGFLTHVEVVYKE